MLSLVPDDGTDSRPSIDLKLGDTTVIGRRDLDKTDSKLSKVFGMMEMILP